MVSKNKIEKTLERLYYSSDEAVAEALSKLRFIQIKDGFNGIPYYIGVSPANHKDIKCRLYGVGYTCYDSDGKRILEARVANKDRILSCIMGLKSIYIPNQELGNVEPWNEWIKIHRYGAGWTTGR